MAISEAGWLLVNSFRGLGSVLLEMGTLLRHAITGAPIAEKSTMMGAAGGILWTCIERRALAVRGVVEVLVIETLAMRVRVLHVDVVHNIIECVRGKAGAGARKHVPMLAVLYLLVAIVVGRVLTKAGRAGHGFLLG